MRNANILPVERPGSNADYHPFGGLLRSEVIVMNARNETRTPTAIPNGNQGGARALAGCVKIALAFDAALSAGAFALAVAWGLALPAAGCAAAFAVSVFMLKGGAA